MNENVSSIASRLLPKEKIQAVKKLDISALRQQGVPEQKDVASSESIMDNEENFINENGEFSANLKLYDDDEGVASLAFHGLAGDVVRAIDPHSESDPIATLINFLTAYGNIIGDSAHFMAGSKKHPARIFAVVVGATGKGRKGSSLSPIRLLFKAIEPDWEINNILSGMSSGEGLIHAVRDEVTKKVPITDGKGKSKKVIDYENVIIDEGIEDKRILVLEEEFGKALRAAKREGNTLSPIIRELWDSGSPRTLTKNPIKATGAHVSMLGQITEEELKKEITDVDLVNGFANRILWVIVKRSKFLPSGGSFHKIDICQLVSRIKEVVEFGKTVGEIRRDEEAEKFWHQIYEELSTGASGLIGSVTSRAEAQTMRLACIYALLDKSDKITITHLKSALDLWYYSFKSARYIFGSSAVLNHPRAFELLEALKHKSEQGTGSMTRTEVSRGVFNGNVPRTELDIIIKDLISNGFIKVEKEKKPGAKKSVQKITLLDSMLRN